MNTALLVDELVKSWPAPIVARHEVNKFSGGLVSPKTLANADCEKRGPAESMRFGKRKIAYPKEALALWLVNQMSTIN